MPRGGKMLNTEIESQEPSLSRAPQMDNQLDNHPSPLKTPPDEDNGPHIMRVKKRDGKLEPVNVMKIVNVVIACSSGLKEVDPMRVATKVISGLYDGASTKELDELCIQTASLLIGEEPTYSRLASRLLARFIDEEVTSQHIVNFYQSIKKAF